MSEFICWLFACFLCSAQRCSPPGKTMWQYSKESISTWKRLKLNSLHSVIMPKDETPPPLPPKVKHFLAIIKIYQVRLNVLTLGLKRFHVRSPRHGRVRRRAWPVRTTGAGSTAASTSPLLWSGRPAGRTSGLNPTPGAHATQVSSPRGHWWTPGKALEPL